MEVTEEKDIEEQRELKKGKKMCRSIKIMIEQYLEKDQKLNTACMDLENAYIYDKIDKFFGMF